MDLGTNSIFCLTEHKKTGFYNRGEECFLRIGAESLRNTDTFRL